MEVEAIQPAAHADRLASHAWDLPFRVIAGQRIHAPGTFISVPYKGPTGVLSSAV